MGEKRAYLSKVLEATEREKERGREKERKREREEKFLTALVAATFVLHREGEKKVWGEL